MSASVSFNPYLQTTGNNGLFNATSTGLRQGTAYQDPVARYKLRTGILSNSETLPMWGGVGIYANIAGTGGQPSYALGPQVGRATSYENTSGTGLQLVGFSTFDQAYGMITSPQSTVPLIGSYGQVMWYGLDSGARLAVQCDPSLASLRGSTINALVSWDFTNQLLIPFEPAVTAITSGTYVPSTGVLTLLLSGIPTNAFSPGDSVTLTSMSGTGAFASLNGTWTALAPTSGTTLTLQVTSGLAATTVNGGNANLGGSAGSALSVDVLDVQTSNCETVVYNSTTGFATWNYNGSCAVVVLNS